MVNYYELVKKYPESPEIGYIVNESMNEFYTFRPDVWKDFWEKKQYKEPSIITVDGVNKRIGEEVWYIDEKGRTKNRYVHELMNTDIVYYSTNEIAKQYKIFNIKLEVEDGIIQGEDKIVYCVCPKSDWGTREIDSISLYYKTTRSLVWKYFEHKENMNEYIQYNKPMYSLSDLIEYWDECYGEQIEIQYSGFINMLKDIKKYDNS